MSGKSSNHLFASILFLSVLLCSCTKKENRPIVFSLQAIPTDSVPGNAPNLFVSENGDAYLSRIAFLDDTTDVLMYSRLLSERWSSPIEISRGNNWFVNWADFPSLAVQGDWLAAHWLQKSAAGTYDYDIHVSTSNDGQRWSPSFIPHTDGVAAEHGFVTLLPLKNGRIFAAWLDGRNTKTKAEHGHEHHHGNGAMTLRCAEFDADGRLFAEAEPDHRICDCCQTDAALTSQGPVVVYRDRTMNEVRDISIVRRINGQWSEPKAIHTDGWEVGGCPVNGPAIAVHEDQLAVVWFTAARDTPMVKLAFSADAGATFYAPIRVDDGQPLGRVDVEWLDGKHALVTWLEETPEGVFIQAAVVAPTGKSQASVRLVETSAARSSGFPVLAKTQDRLLLAWTAVAGDSTRVETGWLSCD